MVFFVEKVEFRMVKSSMDNIEENFLAEKEKKELPDHCESVRTVFYLHAQVHANDCIYA